MHAVPGGVAQRLRHKRRVQAVLVRDDFDDHFEGLDIVGRMQRVVIFEIYFMLAAGDLMMA